MVTVRRDKKVAVVERWQRAKKVVSRYPGAIVDWAIPENIHTIPRTALRISEGEGGFTIMEF